MQSKEQSLRQQIYNKTPGFLQGPCPKGPILTVWHSQSGWRGFQIYWDGKWHQRFRQEALDQLFGISAKLKKTGSQIGYTSEPVIKAAWSYLKNRYNEGDLDVTYSKVQPNLTPAVIEVSPKREPSDDEVRSAVKLAENWRRSGSGESEAHNALKNQIAQDPNLIGVTAVISFDIEHQYPSGDRADLVLESDGSRWTVVEVELEGLVQTVTGLFQAVKYRCLQEAVLCTNKRQGSVSAILAARAIPSEVIKLAHMLSVKAVEVPNQER